mmetsp:Transcript_12778/g.11325  ORF Transcript_12778/g.11325 Transcript_12778/m.11325 type:complete len:92 (-) Transcript_12778:38-313(-)
MTKYTKLTKNIFDYSNISISRLSDILSYYSHTKIDDIAKDQNIARVFEYFVKNGIGEFLESVQQGSHQGFDIEIYISRIQDLCVRFGISQI